MKNNFNLNLSGKVVLITGSTRGLGLTLAKKFLSEGARVIINGINPQRLEEAVKIIGKKSAKSIIAVSADVSSFSEVEKMVKRIDDHWRRLDILVNNAALFLQTEFGSISEEEWDRVLNTNLKGAFNTCRAVVPLMKKHKKGKIINISSEASRAGGLLAGVHYSASKGGLVAFSKALAKELGQYNITVNVVTAGFLGTETSMRHLYNRSLSTDVLIKRTPLGRLVTAEEIGNLILILSSSPADFITGQNFPVSGGMVI